MKEQSVLLVGESCFATVTEYKGVDLFSETNYHEPAAILTNTLEQRGHRVTHIPCHLIATKFPRTAEALSKYDVILFSDVGSNSFLLLPDMVRTGNRVPNLLKLTRDFVANGGGFCMIGGYLTYQGMDAKGKWKDSVIEEILPVTLQSGDDRVEVPEGADLCCAPDTHPVLSGMPAQWPYILGYNKVTAKPEADVLVKFEGDPILAAGTYGKGRTLAYATDCAPHWAPAAMHKWDCYPQLWDNIVRWLAGEK